MGRGVNEPCHCGSGKKYKKCCLRRDQLPPDERDLLDPGPVPQHVKAATDRMMAEEGYTAERAAAFRRLAPMELQRISRMAASALFWARPALE